MADTDSVSKSLTIDTDVDSVLATVTDLEAYPDWLGEFKAAEVTARDDEGRPARADFRLGAVGISVGFTLSYTYAPSRMQWTLVQGDMLHKLDGAYVLADNGDGTTTLTYELEVVSSIPLPGMVRRRVAGKIVSDSLAQIKARAEAG